MFKSFDEVVAGQPQISKPSWGISAGPDSIIQTGLIDNELQGDDIGIRIK